MVVIRLVYKATVFHGENAEHSGVLGLSASKNGAFNTFVPILDQIRRSYKDGPGLKGSGQLDRRALLSDGQRVIVIKVLTPANSLRQPTKGKRGNSRNKENF